MDAAGPVVGAKGQTDVIGIVGAGDALVAGDGVADIRVDGFGQLGMRDIALPFVFAGPARYGAPTIGCLAHGNLAFMQIAVVAVYIGDGVVVDAVS